MSLNLSDNMFTEFLKDKAKMQISKLKRIVTGQVQEKLVNYKCKNLSILLIDVQSGFTDDLNKKDLDEILTAEKVILQEAIKYSIPVAVLEFKGEYSTLPVLRKLIARTKHKYIRKIKNDGFTTIQLDKKLQYWQTKKIIVTGLNANYCVRSTVNSGMKKYQMISSIDLVNSIEEHKNKSSDHLEGLNWLKQNINFYKSVNDVVKLITP